MQLLLHLFLSYTQTVPTNTCMTKTKKEHKPNMQNVTRLVNFPTRPCSEKEISCAQTDMVIQHFHIGEKCILKMKAE